MVHSPSMTHLVYFIGGIRVSLGFPQSIALQNGICGILATWNIKKPVEIFVKKYIFCIFYAHFWVKNIIWPPETKTFVGLWVELTYNVICAHFQHKWPFLLYLNKIWIGRATNFLKIWWFYMKWPYIYMGPGRPRKLFDHLRFGSAILRIYQSFLCKIWLESKKSYENSKCVDQKLSTGQYVWAKAKQNPLSDVLFLKNFGPLIF